jgi:hypothetical protein
MPCDLEGAEGLPLIKRILVIKYPHYPTGLSWIYFMSLSYSH